MLRNVPRPTRVPIQTLILRTIAASGAIGVALVAPKLLRLYKYVDKPHAAKSRTKYRIAQALNRLEESGMITITEGSVELTKVGADRIQEILAGEYRVEEPAFWDGKWRMLIFDIKERQRRRRDELRLLLVGAGLVRLQNSVWVHPYAFDDFVELLRHYLQSKGDEIFYFTAEGLADQKLRKLFNLA